MTTTLFLYTNFQLISPPFSEPSTSQPFSYTTKTLIFKTTKPLNSIPSSSSFSLQNSYFTPKNNNNKDGDEHTSEKTKMPTAPWMKGPIFIPNDEVLDLSKDKQTKKKGQNGKSHKADRSLSEKVSGRRGSKVMKKIVQSIERLKLGNGNDTTQKNWDGTQKNWGGTQKNYDDFEDGFLLGDDNYKKLGGTRKNSDDFGGGFSLGDDTHKKLGGTQKNWDGTQKRWNSTQKKWDGIQKTYDDFEGAFLLGDDTQKNWDGAQKIWDGTQKNRDDFGGGFLLGDDTQKNWDGTQKIWDDFGGGFLVNNAEESKVGSKKPWEKEEKLVFRRMKREKVVTTAELNLDEELLKRLRIEASKMRKWVKVKKAGVTQAVVDEVHSIWANNELVMFKFDLPLCRNMDRAREIVEIKTGGLVVWSRKDSLVAYRGCDYQSRRWSRKPYIRPAGEVQRSRLAMDGQILDTKSKHLVQSYKPYSLDWEKGSLSPGLLMHRNVDRSLYEKEGDRLLDGLGPRYIDWWYPKPLPVDGDLLPEVVPGFKPPFRVCPPRVRLQLTDDELTYLRNFAQPLPVHFVLGRNSKLQGLAVAILKLWERSVIAKIAVKWGVPNTNNELMASELKRLTGGVLLLRNKLFIVLYRGKDFLPGNVANMVVERETELQHWQLREEDARLKAAGTLDLTDATSANRSTIGTYSEFQHIQTICRSVHPSYGEAEVKLEAEKERLEKELRQKDHKLAILKTKIEKAEKELGKLNSSWKPSEEEPDQELITDEERECFRKIGLKLDKVLVLGRRGVFDGVLEGLHQHWKHRELVKVISMQTTYLKVLHTAQMLERESGGTLVCIEKLKKGQAIIIYRGKNYKRPIDFGENLLDKKKALERSLEMQRLGSLKFFAYQRGKEVAELKLKLADVERRRNKMRANDSGDRLGET